MRYLARSLTAVVVISRLLMVPISVVWAESADTPQPLSDEELEQVVFLPDPSSPPENRLADTVWTFTLTPQHGSTPQRPLEDTITFTQDLMRSQQADAEGYSPSAYVLGTGIEGQPAWESTQRRPHGATLFWHGELRGHRLVGGVSRQEEDGLSHSYSFVGTKHVTDTKANAARLEAAPQATHTEIAATQERQLTALSNTLATRTIERDEAQAALATADKNLNDSQKTRQALETELARTHHEVEALQQQLASAAKERDAAHSAQAQSADVQAKLREAETALTDALKDHARLHTELTIIGQQAAQGEDRSAALQADYAALQADAHTTQIHINELNEALARVQQERTHLQEALAQTHEQTVRQAEEQGRDMDRVRAKLQDEQRLEQDAAQLELTVRERTRALVEQETVIASLRQRLEDQERAQTETLAATQRTRSALERALASARAEPSEEDSRLHEEARQLESLLQDLRGELDEQRIAYAVLHDEAQQASHRLFAAQQQLAAQQKIPQPPNAAPPALYALERECAMAMELEVRHLLTMNRRVRRPR